MLATDLYQMTTEDARRATFCQRRLMQA